MPVEVSLMEKKNKTLRSFIYVETNQADNI